MTITRHAVICDRCGARGEEYGPMISCGECGRDLCEKCATNYDPEAPHRAICVDCKAADLVQQAEELNAMISDTMDPVQLAARYGTGAWSARLSDGRCVIGDGLGCYGRGDDWKHAEHELQRERTQREARTTARIHEERERWRGRMIVWAFGTVALAAAALIVSWATRN